MTQPTPSLNLKDKLAQLCGDLPTGSDPWQDGLVRGADAIAAELLELAHLGRTSATLCFDSLAQANACNQILYQMGLHCQVHHSMLDKPHIRARWSDRDYGIMVAGRYTFAVSPDWEITDLTDKTK